jgi:hypothetical protein
VNQYRPKYSIRVFQQNKPKADILASCFGPATHQQVENMAAPTSFEVSKGNRPRSLK